MITKESRMIVKFFMSALMIGMLINDVRSENLPRKIEEIYLGMESPKVIKYLKHAGYVKSPGQTGIAYEKMGARFKNFRIKLDSSNTVSEIIFRQHIFLNKKSNQEKNKYIVSIKDQLIDIYGKSVVVRKELDKLGFISKLNLCWHPCNKKSNVPNQDNLQATLTFYNRPDMLYVKITSTK